MIWTYIKLMWDSSQVDTRVGYLSGSTTVLLTYLFNIQISAVLFFQILQSGLVALVAGFAGVAGKHIFEHFRKAMQAYLKKNKKS